MLNASPPVSFLDDLPPINWDNFAEASATSIEILRRLGNDRFTLRRLLMRIPSDTALWGKCEMHSLDDKIVLYDGLEKNGFRIRFRLATAYQDERPHTHRFSFSTLILRGTYIQSLYRSAYETQEELIGKNLTTIVDRQERAGSTFTIRHDTLHSTIAPPDTISLVLRSPAMKERAIITHQDSGAVWWRVGANNEDVQRRADVAMPRERFDFWIKRLEEYGIIS